MSTSTDKVSPHPDESSQPEQSSSMTESTEGLWQATVIRDILIGQRIGEYVVRRRIGAGGMGVVYEGEHPVIGRKVAIKIIRSDGSEGARARDLVAEARATSSIRHRGIIDIFGFGTLPGIGQYLVMEFLTGQPLNEVMLDRLPLPLPETLRLVIEILGALSAAHGVGVIHRDLKPGNIFVVRESNGAEYVKILDFGLAKQAAAPHSATPQTRTSVVLGTPEYMAPEQACGQAVSPRTDLYAVGTLLFELVTGQLPFKGDSPMHVAIQQVHSPPPAPSSLVEGLPPELEALVLRLLAKAPEQRPSSAEVVARELTEIARVISPGATPRPRAVPLAPLSSAKGPAVAAAQGTGRLPATPSGVGSNATLVSDSLGIGLSTAHTVKLEAASGPRLGALRWVGGGLGMLLLVGGGVVVGMHTAGESTPPPLVRAAPTGSSSSEPVLPPVPPPREVVLASPAPPPPIEPTPPPPPVPEPPVPTVPAQVAPRGPGFVTMSVRCFANLYIDGSLRGQAHTGTLSLSPGAHVLSLRDNPAVEDYKLPLSVRPGQKIVVRAPCRPLE